MAIEVSGFAAIFTGQPLIFPSLGPTAYCSFESPMSRRASPHNTLIGHAVAILAGVLALALFGLLDYPSTLQKGVTLARVGAATLSTCQSSAGSMKERFSCIPTCEEWLILGSRD